METKSAAHKIRKVSSNWERLKGKISKASLPVISDDGDQKKIKKRKTLISSTNTVETAEVIVTEIEASTENTTIESKAFVTNEVDPKFQSYLTKLKRNAVALDCEMVGTGPDGRSSELARCSLVDSKGKVLYDEFVQPKGFVTDFRTRWSGIRKSDISKAKSVTLEEVDSYLSDYFFKYYLCL